MNNQQLQNFFYDKKDTPCPITESLIMAAINKNVRDILLMTKSMVLK